jgi:hypothetical protein
MVPAASPLSMMEISKSSQLVVDVREALSLPEIAMGVVLSDRLGWARQRRIELRALARA